VPGCWIQTRGGWCGPWDGWDFLLLLETLGSQYANPIYIYIYKYISKGLKIILTSTLNRLTMVGERNDKCQ
jgi:hypothetical protein